MGQRPSIQRTRKYRSHHGYVKNINRVRGELSQGSKKCQLISGNLLESLFQKSSCKEGACWRTAQRSCGCLKRTFHWWWIYSLSFLTILGRHCVAIWQNRNEYMEEGKWGLGCSRALESIWLSSLSLSISVFLAIWAQSLGIPTFSWMYKLRLLAWNI